MINLWKEHFVLEVRARQPQHSVPNARSNIVFRLDAHQENMLEIACTNLTPHCTLNTSGHVAKFAVMFAVLTLIN